MNAVSQNLARLDESTVRIELDRLTPDLQAMLPPGMPIDRFKRVALTAVQKVPKLLECHPQSLFMACLQAASDGLLPDGREGAIVPRWNSLTKRKEASWQPMVAGLQAKAKRSGNVASLSAQIVYAGEEFAVVLGDDERIVHRRDITKVARGKEVAVYAIAVLKDGAKEREVMSWQQVMDVRAISDGHDKGPWVAWTDEMARKTVIRRLSKRLPSLDDGDDALRQSIERVDDLYALGHKPTAALAAPALQLSTDAPAEQSTADYLGDALPDEPAPEPQTVAKVRKSLAKATKREHVEKVRAFWLDIVTNAADIGNAVPDVWQDTVGKLLAECYARFPEPAAPADDDLAASLDAPSGEGA